MARLRESDIARQNAGASASATARIPAVQDGRLVTLTPNQIATGAAAVDGPGSSTNNAFMRWDGTTGLLAQNSTSTLDDSGNAIFAGGVTSQGGTLQAGQSGTAGTISVFPSTSARGSISIEATDNTGDTLLTLTNAAQAAARTYTIPDAGGNANFVMTAGTQTLTGTTTIATLNTTNLDVGASGTAGVIDIFPTDASTGKLELTKDPNTGDTTTTINVLQQAAVRKYDVPDAGIDTNFVMDANITNYQKFLGIEDIIHNSNPGPWSTTRVAQGDITFSKSAGDNTTILVLDITESIRTAASKGLQLTGFNYIFRNTTAALDAHSVTLDRVEYTDSDAVNVNSIALTGSLGTGTDTDPQIDSITVTTPAFNTTGNSKYVMELTIDAAAGSIYDFIGVVLTFTRNDFD